MSGLSGVLSQIRIPLADPSLYTGSLDVIPGQVLPAGVIGCIIILMYLKTTCAVGPCMGEIDCCLRCPYHSRLRTVHTKLHLHIIRGLQHSGFISWIRRDAILTGRFSHLINSVNQIFLCGSQIHSLHTDDDPAGCRFLFHRLPHDKFRGLSCDLRGKCD